MSSPHYRRILLKLSGEALKGEEPFGVDPDLLHDLVGDVAELHAMGVQIGLVIGGGNYFRGAQASWMERTSADYVGMMATIMNGVTFRAACHKRGLPCSLFSGLQVEGVARGYNQLEVTEAFERGDVLIFSGGTGHPFFSTDTAAALRAGEIGAELLIKATQVDGVYDADPRTHPEAKRFDKLNYLYLLQHDLRVMDATSVSFCREYQIPILVFDLSTKGNLKRAVLGENVGTIICHQAERPVEDL